MTEKSRAMIGLEEVVARRRAEAVTLEAAIAEAQESLAATYAGLARAENAVVRWERVTRTRKEEEAIRRARAGRRRTAASKPGAAFLVAAPASGVRGSGIIHIARRGGTDRNGVVEYSLICGSHVPGGLPPMSSAHLGTLMRQTHGDLSIALGLLRRAYRAGLFGARCGRCIKEARALLRPAKDREAAS